MDLNKWIGFTNVSASVWKYKELEPKYDTVGRYIRHGPKYTTAMTDCLFFDIDCYRANGEFIEDNYKGMQRLWRFATNNGIRRECAFTSGGYQLTLQSSVRPENYEAAVYYVDSKVESGMDECVHLASLRRVIGSFNFGKDRKSIRNTFCISLTEEEIPLSIGEHIKLAQKQRKGINYYGGETLSLPTELKRKRKKRKLDARSDYTFETGADEILVNYGYDYEDLCEHMKAIIEQPRVGHKERLMIIKYLKTVIGIKYGDMLVLLPKLLTARHGNSTDGGHSVEEGQVYSIYSNNQRFNPSHMKDDGYCASNCDICENYFKKLREI